jgi:hypothetical protein
MLVSPSLHLQPANLVPHPASATAGQATVYGDTASPFALANIVGWNRPTMLRRLEAMSVCSPIAFSVRIHCRHAGAMDALALDKVARCISLKQIVSGEPCALATLFHI